MQHARQPRQGQWSGGGYLPQTRAASHTTRSRLPHDARPSALFIPQLGVIPSSRAPEGLLVGLVCRASLDLIQSKGAPTV